MVRGLVANGEFATSPKQFAGGIQFTGLGPQAVDAVLSSSPASAQTCESRGRSFFLRRQHKYEGLVIRVSFISLGSSRQNF